MNDLAREIVGLSTPPDRPSQFALVVSSSARFDFRNERLDPSDSMIVHAPIEDGKPNFHIISCEPYYVFKYNATSNLDGAAACIYGFLTKKRGDYIRLVGYSEDVDELLRLDPPISEWNISMDRSGDPEAMLQRVQMLKQILKSLLVM